MTDPQVVSVTEIGEADPDQKPGVVSTETIPINELDDIQLEEIFRNNPAWVATYRPGWVKQNHPEYVN